ncbi:cell division protein ZapA [Pseudooceanicola sp. 216_PA32_1]|uniref:Cell division protein ZapA n=1 Tax=Pseudooceanicola pacificus TaxID=2676438 RepID=A0A844W332_9RHOB|nr:cell division protein ZapA [Pseudooceanicola pacificus]MWB77114.1 cell division protein ZapA [Pseudooceanicola pacificus]
MPEVEITIGGRSFEVACAAGEEDYLIAAAAMLDTEAGALIQQVGRIPDARMLLMAGLMLADRTAGVEDKLRDAEAEAGRLRAELEALQSRPAPDPEKVEVPVIPAHVTETLAELAARAEALADTVEEKAAGS